MPVIFLLIPTMMLFIVLKQFELIVEREKCIYSFPEIEKNLDSDRLRLFQTASVMFMTGGAISFLIGFFGMQGKLEYELLLTAVLLLIGIFIRFIPFITKKHNMQNTIFLAICMIGISHFMISNAETGGAAIWSIYILFLLLTVVLGSKIHATIFTVFCVTIQAAFWIIFPEIPITIDGNKYTIRIFVIMLSYLAVRYLSTEYALKVNSYKLFAKEQEILEKISSSFISIDSENAKEKIDEMLEMANEILEFSQAYLIAFSEDYEDATILNTCIKSADSKSFPYHPGMKIKTSALPIGMSLIDQDVPVLCEDISNISSDKAEEQIDNLISRGIKSYCALSIKVDKGKDILVVEYSDRLDINLAESRINFLKLIGNVLADAKKKTLYEERLYNFAYFDETTKLANRNMLKKRLQQIIDSRKESEKIAILDIELENLRMIKDTFGYSAGEQIVIESAEILGNMLKNCCDIENSKKCYEIARSSEEGFVIVLSPMENTKQIEKCAKKVLGSFTHPVLTDTDIEALFVVVNIGISVYPDDGKNVETLLKNAILAGYEAANASDKIVFYSERLGKNIAENTLLTNKLYRSLSNKEFFLEFQPQFSFDEGKTAGVEALLRWNSGDNDRISPSRFVPILEQTGLIYDVGLWVLEQALQEHSRLVVKGFSPLRFSVNLSVVQFRREELIIDFAKIIERSGVDPKYIELEITESVFTENLEVLIEKLHKLKELGINIAIDDFGRGSSSLYRLNMIPFDRIKIDKDIIDSIDLARKRAPVVEMIISLARTFKASITAEGVETKEQMEFLRSAVCDEIQGNYYSKPLPAKALEEFLKEEQFGHRLQN
ncbi:MAG: putative bifunctional diguanylate cyclase/phosphodiesterase [Saccharofermentanales bacterium]